jgi:molybdopterin-guanine dinucleotide biosynthesis protein A
VDAVVLAGGPHDELTAHTPGAPNKAFVKINGVALVERTLRALRQSERVGRIVVVAPSGAAESEALSLADEVRPDGVRISDSLRSGLAGFDSNADLLVSASDLPILTPEAVDDYIVRAQACEADLTYGCIERATHMAKFPEAPHTWARLKDGTYCGTGFITMRPRVWPALERVIERLGRARKNPVKLASLFGWRILLRYALGQLTIAHAEARASYVIGAKVRAVVSPYAEIGINVDRVSDIALAERYTG